MTDPTDQPVAPAVIRASGPADGPAVPVSVVVPVRNAEAMIVDCLDSIVASRPAEIIVVDGLSTDRTTEIASRYPVTILSDEGRGVAAARSMGMAAATRDVVALIDVDVVLPPGSLGLLYGEFVEGQYVALQAGLESVSGNGYWGRALATHHRSGRSRNWFGLVATIADRSVLLREGLDESFMSGEDIDLRWRLQSGGHRVGVSERTMVQHRFDDTFDFAKGQWLADGRGFGRMLIKHRWRVAWLAWLPGAASARGIALSLIRRQPGWIPYYVLFLVYNYIGMVGAIRERLQDR
jgi:glycosyltransferase involved in cell wall biosynthesis